MKNPMVRKLLLPPAVGTAAMIAGCGQLLAGALTAGQALVISPQDELAIGQKAAQDYLAQHQEVTDPAIQQEVNTVGGRVVANSLAPGAAYSFHVVKEDDLNAFALPGGPIFVTTALMKTMKDDAQLAGVIGHEASHVALHHGLNRLKEALVLQGVAIAALGDQPQLLQQAASIALGIYMKGHDRGAETEADLRGTEAMAKAGYDPTAVLDTLRTFQARGDVPGILVWASDHPALADRITAVQSEISAEHLAGGTRDQARYQTVLSALSKF